MKVYLKTNVINDITGAELTLNLREKASLRELLDQIALTHGVVVKDRLFIKERLRPDLTILVNGKPVSDADLDRELPEDCGISLIQMLSGG